MRRLTGLAALAALWPRFLTPGTAQPPASEGSLIPSELLVRYRGSPEARPALFAPISADARYNDSLDVWRLKLPPDTEIDDAVSRLLEEPAVELAQPNYRYAAASAGDDPLYVRSQHPYYAAINAPAAWAIETGSPDVIVAVLDDGVDIGHPELDSRIWTNPAEIAANLIDDDANGCVDDLHGCNFLAGIPEADVDEGEHGTFVSGIIAAESENGEGVRSMAPGVTIMPVVVLDEPGLGSVDPAIGTTEGLAAGILYAARSGADVLNLSLALDPIPGGICPTDPLVEDALRQAHDDYGATIVASAGNFNIPCVTFPAASQYAIAVGAAGPPAQPDIRAIFSSWGEQVGVAAPGMDLISTCPDPVVQGLDGLCLEAGYGAGSGTSFAAPLVSGLAALLLSEEAAFTNEQVRERLQSTARDLPDEQNPNWDGAGMIDAGAALGAGSAYAIIDSTAASAADLTFTIEGRQGGTPCEVRVWDRPAVAVQHVSGSFGVGECAKAWPPSPGNEWRLRVRNSGRKAAKLNPWSLRSGDTVCASQNASLMIPPGAEETTAIACQIDGLVVNDVVANALSVSSSRLPRRFEQDLRYATSSGDPPPSCAGSISRGVWYKLPSVTAADALVVDTFGSQFDTVLAVFKGSPEALDEVACNDEFMGHQSRVVWRTESNVDYYLMASAFQTVPAGLLRVNFNPALIPTNDERDATEALAVGGQATVQPAHSVTLSASDPALSCVGSYGSSLWFRVLPEATGSVTVETTGSDYNTVAAVFTEAGGTLGEVACNNDAAPGTRTSRVTWDAASGQTYWVAVVSSGNRGAGTLRVQASTN